MASAASGGGEVSAEVPVSLPSVPSRRMKPSQGRPSRIPSVKDLVERNEGKWTVFSASQNLTTALNDPSNREVDLFTRTWGSYFVPTASLPASPFPSIEVTDFLRYLRETSSGRKVHRATVRQLSKEKSESCWSPTSLEDFPPLISQLQQDGRNYDVACIPRIFMQRDFSLEDPPTFLEVLPLTQLLPRRKPAPKQESRGDSDEQAKGESASADVKVKVDSSHLEVPSTRHRSLKLLHEELTHYLDVIEVHLAYQISQRSDVFFSTLSSQQELQSYVMQLRQDVIDLRYKIRQVGSTATQGSLEIFNKCRRLQRFKQLHKKLDLISEVHQTQLNIQGMLRRSDYVGALDLISITQEVLQQELQGVRALRYICTCKIYCSDSLL